LKALIEKKTGLSIDRVVVRSVPKCDSQTCSRLLEANKILHTLILDPEPSSWSKEVSGGVIAIAPIDLDFYVVGRINRICS